MSKAEEERQLQAGFCIKSPCIEKHRWKRRWFVLETLNIPDVQKFHKKYYKHYKKGKKQQQQQQQTVEHDSTTTTPTDHYLVLTYYKKQRHQAKSKHRSRFLLDGCNTHAQVSDHPSGVGTHTYVIRIQLPQLMYRGMVFDY